MHLCLYVDGGMIKRNPSTIGGTWAYIIVALADGSIYKQDSGVVTPSDFGVPAVSNNQTEMYAMLQGLKALPVTSLVNVYSDSMITLGRINSGWKWTNIPPFMHEIYKAERKRLIAWPNYFFQLLDGHPTQAQLDYGIGKRGHPVSIHNVWCDEACRAQAEGFMKSHE